MNKEEMREQVAELQAALRTSQRRQALSRRRSRRLASALRDETRRFEELRSYVERLKNWALGNEPPNQETEEGGDDD